MRHRTRTNTITLIAGLTAIEALGPNPYRKAIIMSPIIAGSGGVLTAAVFTPGLLQKFPVPAGVSTFVDIYTWGPGGNAGNAGVVLGGGGGGGGGFGSSGGQTVAQGASQFLVWTINVGSGGSGVPTEVKRPVGSTASAANAGVNALLDAGGAGGAGAGGVTNETGGAGEAATGLAGAGAGGGGAAGYASNGSAGAGSVGGSGGGSTTLLTYGLGGTGGNGSASTIDGLPGGTPGGGGGGGGNTAHDGGVGGDGLAIIFYSSVAILSNLSMSPRSDVVAGRGTLNWQSGQPQNVILWDQQIGDQIGAPWFVISDVAGTVIQITEWSCEPDYEYPAF